jgi:hypothetical protein
MSILTDLLAKKITFSQAAAEVVQWGEKLIAKDPNVTNAVGVIVSDGKQAASNAVALAGTALGNLIAPAASVVESTTNALIVQAVGPLAASELTPAADNAIETIASFLKSEIDAAVTAAKAALATPAAPAASASGS